MICSFRDREPVFQSCFWFSKMRSRLPLEVHEVVFAWVLARLDEHELVKGDRIGINGPYQGVILGYETVLLNLLITHSGNGLFGATNPAITNQIQTTAMNKPSIEGAAS